MPAESYRRAAESGSAEAQYRLGGMYYTGQGVRLDNDRALEWYRKAAEQGNPDAQYRLGRLYDKGLSVRQDYAKALE